MNSLQTWIYNHVSVFSCHPPSPLHCPVHLADIKKNKTKPKNRSWGRFRNPTCTEEFVPQDAQRKSPPGDLGQVQSDLLPYNMDQTLLQEISRFSASSLPPPPPVQIDFVLPVFLCLTKKAKVTCCQWIVAKKTEWPLKTSLAWNFQLQFKVAF